VRVARCLSQLPLTHAAFAQGQLSYAKVRALTRVATGENEEELLELACVCTAAQLERTVRGYRRVTTAEAREQLEDAYLNVFWSPDGSLEIHGRLAPEDGALLLRALDAMRDDLWEKDNGSAEPRPARQASNAEALVAAADVVFSGRAAGRSAGERYQVVVHADESALAHDGEGGCELEDGSALAPETARRLSCDASIVRNGRRTRAIPPAVRRALRTRDRGCRFPGCQNRRFVDAHHVHHWAQGGETALDNLVLLCRHHHRLVHEGGYRVDHDGRFFYPWGGEIAAVPRLPRGDPAELAERHATLGIDEATIECGFGEKLDLELAVDVLLAAA
jgi:5-methylcytosine-specific restriction endonuclease McrA